MAEKTDLFGKARETRAQSRAAARSMADLVRMMALAGIGAAALAKDQTEHIANRLVERGAQARQEAGSLAESIAERSHVRGGQALSRAERRMGGVLNRLSVPTREDLAAVNAKIAVLSAKIDAMQAEPGGTAEDIDPSTQI